MSAILVVSSCPMSGLAFADDPIPLLERTVTISLEHERLEVALKKISAQAGFTFSYNSNIIDANKIVSQNFTGKTVREVLDQIFGGSIQYKARGKYIILTKTTADEAKDQRVLSGYVVDESTGKRLQNVSVYDPVSLSSTVTDSYGYFELKVDQPSGEEVKLAVRKMNYSDTVVAVTTDRRELMNIQMREHADKVNALADSVKQKIKRFWQTKVRSPQAVNMENIQDTIYRKFQFSVFPFVGTNHKLSGNVINDYSVNLFGGYSLGVKKLEFGGIFNVVRSDVTGAQFAGIFNAVGGKMKFIQMAGIFNMNRDSVSGYQFAGMVNLNGNSSSKLSGAGLLNLTLRDARGTHLAGLGNATIGKQDGAQVAGLFNFSTQDSRGAQVAGLTNVTVGNFNGGQVSGLLNFTLKEMKGAQVSGLLNYATKIKGAQIGIINATDSIDGVPIGVISFVLKGYHKIEVSADEIFYTNVAFRTGIRQFYNILTAGAKPDTFEDEETHWTFGYGIGTAPRLSRRLSL
ncbi:MAG TPA: STN and carboxypeptidase regulatory-like domain-containing protein, partial [Chryseolinea sp.]|nr:STN and carboxypeptidase regulatory-like domain-containing protein [Chryseolinea sp.]